jgi:hypothetical protein
MSESVINRPFNVENIPPEVKKQLDALRESASEVARKDPEAFDNLMMEQIRILELEKERQKVLYPANPPNKKCHHALLKGMLFSIPAGLKLHDFIPFFRVGPETVYVWAHSQNQYPALLLDVDTSVASQNIWRTLASILELTEAISSSFEHMVNCDYDWIYNFIPEKSIDDNVFLDSENFGRLSGSIHELSYFADCAPLIELLYRDERFYVMCVNLLASFYNHHFCLECAFQKDGYQMHPNHELPSWQVAQAIPQMEVAIVQATRTIEAVLGKPGKRDIDSKLRRILERWHNSIDLEPNETFKLTDTSYLDYYYELFAIRGYAAHSLGSFPYQISRQLTIQAQCFAWVILNSYYQRNALSEIDARNVLKFNLRLIEN